MATEITVNAVTFNTSYNVNKLGPQNGFPETQGRRLSLWLNFWEIVTLKSAQTLYLI